jgi:hypothetical protein
MVKVSEKLEENLTAEEIIKANNEAEEMIKKQAAYKSSYLKIFFDFSVRELKDEKIINFEFNKVFLLKVSYQERLILLIYIKAEEGKCKKFKSQTDRV